MARKTLIAAAALALISVPALAQASSTYNIVEPTKTSSTNSDFTRPGDVSPAEISRVLEEADRIRAFQAATGAAPTTYVANAGSTAAPQPQTYAEYIAARRQAQLQAQSQTTYQPQAQPVYQPQYAPQYQPRPTYQVAQPTYQQPRQQSYVQAPLPQNRVYQPPVNNPVIYAATPNVTGSAPAVHTVIKGDTLYSLSKRYGVSLAELKRANGLSGNLINVGQRLNLPGSIISTPVSYSVPIQNTVPLQYTTPAPVTRHETSPTSINHVPTSYGTTVGSNVIRAVQPVPPSGVYAVLPNDTVYGIARFACVNPYDVARLNGITETATLTPGQKLSMPAGHCLN